MTGVQTCALPIYGCDLAGMPPYRRPVNMMFQSYALFPHLNVYENVAFGLRRKGLAKDVIEARVRELLRLTQLTPYGARRINELSGGQRQRVALARALAPGPTLLLLDEPLGALDRKLREETQFHLKQIQRETGTSFMIVTHDQDEALALADRVAVMRAGRIEQVASPNDIYDRVYAPEHVKGNSIRVVVDVIEPLGSEIHLNVTAGKHNLVALVDTQTMVRMHQEIELAVDLNKMHLFEKDPPNLRVITEK